MMKLKEAMKRGGWMHLRIVERCTRYPTDDELLQTIEQRLTKNTKWWHQLSTMTELWRICGRVTRLQKEAQRKRAKLHLSAALRKKGLLTNPWKPMIVKCPKSSSISPKGVQSNVRMQLRKSSLPRLIAKGIRIKVVSQKAPTGINILKNHKQTIDKMGQEQARCTCSKCPKEWTRVSGHVAFRTRESMLQPDMLRQCLNSPLFYDGAEAKRIASKGIWEAMRIYIPDYVMPEHRPRTYANIFHPTRREPRPQGLTVGEFKNLKRSTAHLTWVPIDKAPGEMLAC